jgi:hypothetical protein
MLDMARQARELVAGRTRPDYDGDVTLRLALADLPGLIARLESIAGP